jgi:hypothetical protein
VGRASADTPFMVLNFCLAFAQYDSIACVCTPNVISEHVHVYVNVYVKYILQRMIQIKNMHSFGSFLYFVFFKRVLYCWSIILMSKQYNTFYEKKLVFQNCDHQVQVIPKNVFTVFVYMHWFWIKLLWFN